MNKLRSRLRSGFSLVEMLVVVVIIIAAAAWLLPNYLGKGSKDGKRQTPMSRARGTVCTSNIRQVRMSIDMAHQSDEESKFPASLMELRGLPNEFRKCPDGGEAYVYNPGTGTVYCPHPGHERF